jgi:hypothetical protein
MLRDIARGVAAGAIGTVALNITTYADMVIRGRAASRVPAKVADTLLQSAGIELADEGDDTRDSQSRQDREAQHRLTGLGALMGYGVGLGLGGLYGLARPRLGKLPVPLAGVVVGLAAMAASDVPAVAMRATDPKTWGASGWLADIIPHLMYGLVTVGVYDALRAAERPARRAW